MFSISRPRLGRLGAANFALRFPANCRVISSATDFTSPSARPYWATGPVSWRSVFTSTRAVAGERCEREAHLRGGVPTPFLVHALGRHRSRPCRRINGADRGFPREGQLDRADPDGRRPTIPAFAQVVRQRGTRHARRDRRDIQKKPPRLVGGKGDFKRAQELQDALHLPAGWFSSMRLPVLGARAMLAAILAQYIKQPALETAMGLRRTGPDFC